MSPAQDVSCTEHIDSPGDVHQTGTAHADSPSEAVIVAGMLSRVEPQSTAITKPNSTGIVLTKEFVCVPCSPIPLASSQSKNDEAQTLTQCGSSLDGSGNQVLQPISSSPTHCVDLGKTLVPTQCVTYRYVFLVLLVVYSSCTRCCTSVVVVEIMKTCCCELLTSIQCLEHNGYPEGIKHSFNTNVFTSHFGF